MASYKRHPIATNPYSSMVAYPDLYNKDLNAGVAMSSEKEKKALENATYEKFAGKQIVLVHRTRGEVYYVDIVPFGSERGYASSRCWINNLLFGELRLATEEDIKKAKQRDDEAYEMTAKTEAIRQAKQAGQFFKEILGAAGSVEKFNEAQKAAALEQEKEPTEADLDKLQEKIDLARKVIKGDKQAAKKVIAKE